MKRFLSLFIFASVAFSQIHVTRPLPHHHKRMSLIIATASAVAVGFLLVPGVASPAQHIYPRPTQAPEVHY